MFRIGRFGLSLECQAFAYPVRPDAAPSWSVGLEGKVLFRRGQIRESIRERRNLAAVLRSSPVPGANEAEQGIADFGNTLLRVGFDSQAVFP